MVNLSCRQSMDNDKTNEKKVRTQNSATMNFPYFLSVPFSLLLCSSLLFSLPLQRTDLFPFLASNKQQQQQQQPDTIHFVAKYNHYFCNTSDYLPTVTTKQANCSCIYPKSKLLIAQLEVQSEWTFPTGYQ